MNAAPVVVGKQNRYLRRFQEAGATNPDSARTLRDLGCRPSFVFDRLVSRGVFVELPAGRYFLDIARATAFRSRRRMLILVVLGIAVVTLVALMWIR